MYAVVLILMLLIVFNFLLKQTFWQVVAVGISAVVAGLFVGCMWPYAIEQSKTQIESWLNNPELMLDTSVILTLDVSFQMAYCLLAVHVHNAYPVKKRMIRIYRVLRWIPGLLIYPVLFSGLVYAIFAFPGMSFQLIGWSCAGVVFLSVLLGSYLLLWLLPEKELRLELLFLSNALVAILGIIATVNGRTAVQGVSTVDWASLAGLVVIILVGGCIGLFYYRRKNLKNNSSK